MCKMGLRATGHGLARLPEWGALGLAVSTSTLLEDPALPPFGKDDGPEDEVSQLPPAARHEEMYELLLLDEITWETLDRCDGGHF